MAKQSMRLAKLAGFSTLILLFLVLCKPDSKNPDSKNTQSSKEIIRPAFSSDSAYQYIQNQVDFGPRTPGSEAHKACADWLVETLKSFGATVQIQEAKVTRYDGVVLPMYNIIASYNPTAQKRLLLCAHWDTRHVADQDDSNRDKPIIGANDGGSGVGTLLEVARQLQLKSPNSGVDIILFDVEDQGQPDYVYPFKADTYCLGSQYWAKTPHQPSYTAQKGILLDMMGAKDAIFTLEGTSMQFAPEWMRSVWDKAIALNHSKHFHYNRTSPITDDHYYINVIAGIPTIDIIQNDKNTRSGFGEYWHTHDDNMDIIDKSTLQAVGETILAVVYEF